MDTMTKVLEDPSLSPLMNIDSTGGLLDQLKMTNHQLDVRNAVYKEWIQMFIKARVDKNWEELKELIQVESLHELKRLMQMGGLQTCLLSNTNTEDCSFEVTQTEPSILPILDHKFVNPTVFKFEIKQDESDSRRHFAGSVRQRTPVDSRDSKPELQIPGGKNKNNNMIVIG
ncbi:hypothetical protein BDB01DRAFT_839143 [Pilobolus umbonatus]|nr:hypothetical protein BDB01DRAFT_839143 [Pilobolus umbonatus]